MLIAWTSVPAREDADRLAEESVRLGLAACAQIEGPLTSLYVWKGKTETAQEYRLMFKMLEERSKALESYILSHHPYQTPEWIVVETSAVSEKYLSWAQSEATNRPL